VYLIFNEGYSASTGERLTRGELCGEAIRLGRLLTELQKAISLTQNAVERAELRRRLAALTSR
jgi:predicted RNA polymerase sigma factor